MHTINHSLEEKIFESEGRYLDAQELRGIENYVQSYVNRLETYHNLRDRSSQFVNRALEKLGQAHPDIIEKSGERCHYDMTSVLRYMALSILRDDEVFFTEEIMSWLDTVLVAYKRNAQCATAYQLLMSEMRAVLPSSNINLIRPYIESVVNLLQSHAK